MSSVNIANQHYRDQQLLFRIFFISFEGVTVHYTLPKETMNTEWMSGSRKWLIEKNEKTIALGLEYIALGRGRRWQRGNRWRGERAEVKGPFSLPLTASRNTGEVNKEWTKPLETHLKTYYHLFGATIRSINFTRSPVNCVIDKNTILRTHVMYYQTSFKTTSLYYSKHTRQLSDGDYESVGHLEEADSPHSPTRR